MPFLILFLIAFLGQDTMHIYGARPQTVDAIHTGMAHFTSEELDAVQGVYIADGQTGHLTEPAELQDNPTWRFQATPEDPSTENTCGQAWGVGYWYIVIRDADWCNAVYTTIHEICHLLSFTRGDAGHGDVFWLCMMQHGGT